MFSPSDKQLIPVIMAGGMGRRMNSNIPKVLHKIAEEPMLVRIIKTVIQIKPPKILIIVGKYRDIIKDELEKHGLVISGMSPDNNLIEMIEIKDHPYFVASQFHPEFKSRPWEPAPMFKYFIEAASENNNSTKKTLETQKVKD